MNDKRDMEDGWCKSYWPRNKAIIMGQSECLLGFCWSVKGSNNGWKQEHGPLLCPRRGWSPEESRSMTNMVRLIYNVYILSLLVALVFLSFTGMAHDAKWVNAYTLTEHVGWVRELVTYPGTPLHGQELNLRIPQSQVNCDSRVYTGSIFLELEINHGKQNGAIILLAGIGKSPLPSAVPSSLPRQRRSQNQSKLGLRTARCRIGVRPYGIGTVHAFPPSISYHSSSPPFLLQACPLSFYSNPNFLF